MLKKVGVFKMRILVYIFIFCGLIVTSCSTSKKQNVAPGKNARNNNIVLGKKRSLSEGHQIGKYDIEQGDNLLTNGGFESGLAGWGSMLWSNPKYAVR